MFTRVCLNWETKYQWMKPEKSLTKNKSFILIALLFIIIKEIARLEKAIVKLKIEKLLNKVLETFMRYPSPRLVRLLQFMVC